MTQVQDFAHAAARKYLQSVVFVDDKIYAPIPARVINADKIDVPVVKMNVFKPTNPVVALNDAGKTNDPAKPAEDEEPAFAPKDLVESFARQRMVCALFQPDKGFKVDSESDLFRLCERADAVILDWEFYKEPGTAILPLLSNLVTDSQTTVPHHVRLLAIYTTTPDLQKVASTVYDHLKGNGLSIDPNGAYRLDAGSSRIVVLGKPTIGRPKEQMEAAEVVESGLANRIIKEFAEMHEGILPSMALHGLASIRTNAKKILDKFRREMDGAFLVHRGLILPSDDAFEQIPELVAEEALAVMLDSQYSASETKKLAEEVIDGFAIKTVWPVKNNSTPAAGEVAIKLLKHGPEKVRKQVDLDVGALSKLHSDLDQAKISGKERLASLYVSRTHYTDARPLTFGTIVRHRSAEGDAEYSICLMPLCDCVRLKLDREYSFPFWKLRTDNLKQSSKGMVFELPGTEGFVELFSMGKPRDQLWMGTFAASASKTVTATKVGETHSFSEKNGTEFEWIAQLKPIHAQRIAQDIANSFSRVGVLEAEWLRLKADRQ